MSVRPRPWNIEFAIRLLVGGTLDDYTQATGCQRPDYTRKTIPPSFLAILLTQPADEVVKILKDHLAWYIQNNSDD